MITITSQPTSINAAYRPILVSVALDVLMPIVYCDIYFNSVYYKSVSSTLQSLTLQFDAQDAAQEFLRGYLPPNGGSQVKPALESSVVCFVKLRGSVIDVNGFTVIDGPVPIQAVDNTPAIAGGGVSSAVFYIVNSTLQHADNQNLPAHLNSFKVVNSVWDASAWPLSHRQDNRYRVAGSDYFPVIYTGTRPISCVQINYFLKNGSNNFIRNCVGIFPNCPLLTNIVITSVNNGDGTQTFTFNWDPADSLLNIINVGFRVNGSGAIFSTYAASVLTGNTLILPLGLYEFQFQGTGACIATTSPIQTGKGIAAPACVPAASAEAFNPPNAITGAPYNYTFVVAGTPVFNLLFITKPAWMILTAVGNTIALSGTPAGADAATGVTVAFRISNTCGFFNVTDTIDVVNIPHRLIFNVNGRGTSAAVYANFNAPVDVQVEVMSMFANGYASTDCSGAIVSTIEAYNRFIPAGSLGVSGNQYPSTTWTANSYTILGVVIKVGTAANRSVFPGDVVTMGSYSVTIQFDGC